MNLKYVNGGIMKNNQNNYFDEYFTKPEIAVYFFNKTKEIISQYENLEKFTWLEPSVGDGCFYKLLPHNKIGIDIHKTTFDTLQMNYLHYQLPKKPLVIIGNPPFGHRGVLALEFINHSQNADFVAFILPIFFQSLGKGSIRYRVKKFHLLYEENLPHNAFYLSNGKEKDVKTCFQIWSKKYKNTKEEFSWYKQKEKQEPFHNILKVVTVSLAKNRECGKEWIFDKKANFYLSSTFFKENAVVKDFSQVKYKSGVAIIYNKNAPKRKLDKLFLNANWNKYSSLATNGCRHIGKSHIFQLLQDEGFCNA
ncbi:SAM-dependent methyltransferase [Helicobacter sp. MIT 14-3879]|uniref:SAM-dependent methyltransferase n=1 Tax=Helicobacter sp. MIT 14-3879 TaxID=2040649 RepID=UPI000E1EA1BE|nr:SAM-dependent methyltransferase [Helicobacter sp. MIT 14-3879]RDU65028.1 SAM-dependent methyltransferase [Helicobacter sp. MIT 14-3879]